MALGYMGCSELETWCRTHEVLAGTITWHLLHNWAHDAAFAARCAEVWIGGGAAESVVALVA